MSIYDVDQNQVTRAMEDIQQQLEKQESRGLLRGKFNAKEQLSFIKPSTDLKDCVSGAIHVQVTEVIPGQERRHCLRPFCLNKIFVCPWGNIVLTNPVQMSGSGSHHESGDNPPHPLHFDLIHLKLAMRILNHHHVTRCQVRKGSGSGSVPPRNNQCPTSTCSVFKSTQNGKQSHS